MVRNFPISDLRTLVIVNEGKKGVSSTPYDWRYHVQDRAREDNAPSRWSLDAAAVVLGKADLAAFEVSSQIDRECKTTVGSEAGAVISMGSEMTSILGSIAADEVTLHASDFHEEELFKLWQDLPSYHALDMPH